LEKWHKFYSYLKQKD